MNDELPNDGEMVAGLYEPPVDTASQEKITKEHNTVAKSVPIVDDVIEWFDAQIDACNSLANIDLDHVIPAESQVMAYQKLAELLINRRTMYKQWYDSWQKGRYGSEPKKQRR